jgi:hypothetical protein
MDGQKHSVKFEYGYGYDVQCFDTITKTNPTWNLNNISYKIPEFVGIEDDEEGEKLELEKFFATVNVTNV